MTHQLIFKRVQRLFLLKVPVVDATPASALMFEQAEKEERQYDWLAAAESYREALAKKAADPLGLGGTSERLGFALYMAAMQSDSATEFRSRVSEAVEHYNNAKESYSRQNDLQGASRKHACGAMVPYLESLVTQQPQEKKKLLDESWKELKESLSLFEVNGDPLGYAETYCKLSRSISLLYALQWDSKAIETTLREAWEQGERAAKLLANQKNQEALARVRVITAVFLNLLVDNLSNPDEQEKYGHKAKEYWTKARELSEDEALLQLADNPLGGFLFGADSADAIKSLEKALEYARRARDRLTIGSALDQLAYHIFVTVYGTEDPERKTILLKRAMEYAQGAKDQYSIISFKSPRGGGFLVDVPQTDQYLVMAQNEADREERRSLLEKAVKMASDQLRQAEDSGFPIVIGQAHWKVSVGLAYLARMEKRKEEGKKLLEEALTHLDEYVRITEQIQPFFYWNRGAGLSQLADIKSDLAVLEEEPEKKRLLTEAILAKEESLKLCNKDMPFIERTGSVSMILAVGLRKSEYGDLLTRLFKLTNDAKQLRISIESFEDAAGTFGRVGHTVRVAECYWKIGQGFGTLEDHLKASESFARASRDYETAAEKIPQLKEIYTENASYMKAWAAVEKAKYYHEREEYENARRYYEQAAGAYRSVNKWAIFADSFSAWAEIEKGEDLSRNEHCEEAIDAFQKASLLFNESKSRIQGSLAKIDGSEERELATNLIRAADIRRAYCSARAKLEEARILGKKGDYNSSSEKYEQAAASFETIVQGLEPGRTRREFEHMHVLSKAWQNMSRAEGETSPELYGEASRLFEQARELSLNEKQGMLALGHSRFCKALQAGTGLVDTGDLTIHSTIAQNLESATSHYLKAGFRKESEYAKASKLLFDAYVYMHEASKEREGEKKTRLYDLAEKVLQASATTYDRAEHVGRKEHVERLLEKVRDEKQLATSLGQLLIAPTAFSPTAGFSTPEPTQETPVGLERFQHADIQARLIARHRSVRVGEAFSLEIEIVNGGKGPATLMRVEEIIPKGFELTDKPETCRVDDGSLDMRGKRLGPLKTEEIRLVFKPGRKGQFALKPRILYLDEDGRYKSHEPEELQFTVTELGIFGWIKGQ